MGLIVHYLGLLSEGLTEKSQGSITSLVLRLYESYQESLVDSYLHYLKGLPGRSPY